MKFCERATLALAGNPLHPLVTAAACQAIEAYAPYAAHKTNLLEVGITYAVVALSSQEGELV